MQEKVTCLGPNGRIVIPAPFRRALGLEAGDKIVVVLDPRGGLRLLTPKQAIQHAQELVAKYVKKGRRLSRELLEERKEESRRG
ncbi:MAG: AbrB/MazE/SpoVT family DNA-binding domain-containing protein [Planctomycetota bacterium]|jgi:AbrB family looped-hinge helix DNA binding protein